MYRSLSKLISAILYLLLVFNCTVSANEFTESTNATKHIGIYYSSSEFQSNNNQGFGDFSLQLKQNLSNAYPTFKITVLDLNNKLPFEIDETLQLNRDFAITIGEGALLNILASRSKIPLFALNTPRITLDRMRKIYSELNIQLSGIYREQPLRNQLALANAIRPLDKNIYLLLGRMSRYHLNEYKQQVADLNKLTDDLNNYIMHYQLLKNQDSPVAYLNKIQPQTGFLMLLDNPQQFSRQKVELLVPAGFKQGIPMIGNRKLHGSLGALASVYSSKTDLILETNKSISGYFKNKGFRAPRYLESYSVFVNQQIAQNFDLNTLNEEQLKSMIESKRNQTQLTEATNL